MFLLPYHDEKYRIVLQCYDNGIRANIASGRSLVKVNSLSPGKSWYFMISIPRKAWKYLSKPFNLHSEKRETSLFNYYSGLILLYIT